VALSLSLLFHRETSWFGQALAAQGQYRVVWDPENAGGYSALLTLTSLDGDERKIRNCSPPGGHRALGITAAAILTDL
jgi:hypothetical protein